MYICRSSIFSAKQFAAAALLPLLCLFLPIKIGAARAQYQTALPQKSGESVRETDLRAFCPPIEFAESGYSYNLYAGSGKQGGNIAYQAALTDITRDCRYDNEAGLVHLHIAAAGRVAVGSGSGRAVLNLPILVTFGEDGETALRKTYSQKVTLQQSSAATQFLFSEKLAVRQAEAVKGSKIIIGFADAMQSKESKPAKSERQANKENKKSAPKPRANRISPHAADNIIPETF